MRKMNEFKWGRKILTAVSSLVLVLMLGLLAEPFTFVSNAQSQGKVTASSAKIRKEASTSSEALGSALKDAEVTINNQVTGSDGKVWYQVFVNAETLGYIRSDLVEIIDGTTPPTGSGTTTTTPNANENTANVEAVQPIGGTVTGSQSVRVRANASTGSQIVTMVDNGMALTVTGKVEGNDGKVWYQVNFISNGSEVTGFIRSDYVALSGELTPPVEDTTPPETTTPPVEETPQEPETPAETVVETKDWDTQNEDGVWYLVDNAGENPGRYKITDIFAADKHNQEALVAAQKKVKDQTALVIVLVILAVVMAGVIAYLVFKMKDMKDSVYFAQVERDTIRRRTADRPAGSGNRVSHTVGTDGKPGGLRSAGAAAQGSQKTVVTPAQNGQRSAGTSAQNGQRPTGTSAQNGQRPVGTSAQNGQRPAGTPAQNGQRPVGTSAQNGQRPAGAPAQNGQRPAGAPAQNGQRPAGTPAQNSQRPAASTQSGVGQSEIQKAAPKPQQSNTAQKAGGKSRDFTADEDEFEFEFLNLDGEDE